MYVYLEAQFTREKKLTYRMPLVQGMQVVPILDLGQSGIHDLHDATFRFVGACMSQGSSGQWHAILMSEKLVAENMTEYLIFQTPLLQNRHVALKREEPFCDRYPYLQLQSNKVYAHEIRLPEYAEDDTSGIPTKLPFDEGVVAEEAVSYKDFQQVLAFAWEKIAAEEKKRSELPGETRAAGKVGDTKYWTIASSNFTTGLTFRLVGKVSAARMVAHGPLELADIIPCAKERAVPGDDAGEGSKKSKGKQKAVPRRHAKGKGGFGDESSSGSKKRKPSPASKPPAENKRRRSSSRRQAPQRPVDPVDSEKTNEPEMHVEDVLGGACGDDEEPVRTEISLEPPESVVEESQSEKEEEPVTRRARPLSKKEKVQDMVFMAHLFLFNYLLIKF